VIPVLFEHSLRKAAATGAGAGDAVLTVAQVLGMAPAAARLRNPATDSEVVLALRVLEGCCLLCPACAAAAHRYNAVKVRHVRPRDRRCTSAFVVLLSTLFVLLVCPAFTTVRWLVLFSCHHTHTSTVNWNLHRHRRST